MEKTVCELFAGVGGFRLGLERSSSQWRTVWFSQWEPNKKKQWAHDCYVAHWGDIDERTGIDIALVDKTLIPDHNLLVGGFPCQDYSVARPLPGSTGIEGKKGVLWWQIRDILQIKRPPFGLFENVDRLLKSPASQRGRDFGIILACLADLGYSAEWRVINAAEYGAGQRRRRIFIFAFKDDTVHAGHLFHDPDDILTKTGLFARAFPVESMGPVCTVELPQCGIAEISATFKFPFENAGYMHRGTIVTAKVGALLEPAVPLGELLETGVPERFYLGKDLVKWGYLKGSKKVSRTSRTGHRYTFSEGAIAFPDPLDKPARTMLTSESSLNRSTHVVQDPQTGDMRLLTPVEAERIQGFDDHWTDTGMPEKSRYFCMGNALVVPMVTRMGKVLEEIFALEGGIGAPSHMP